MKRQTDAVHSVYGLRIAHRRSPACTSGALLAMLASCLVGALLAGCASSKTSDPRWQGPSAAAAVGSENWIFSGRAARIVRTDHYAIHTTITDADFLQSLAQLMEGAYVEYRDLTPGVAASDRAMDCYVFAQRPEWAQFTAAHTGQDAAVYLQINRGGYTRLDWFVAYYIGDTGTFAVAAHEGWHQYVARHFKTRLPPFLEEGIATMFENIRWSGQLPRWDLGINPNRVQRLRRAVDDHKLFPLEQLICMHAGDVVGMKGGRIEAFYAQDWAFAVFLLHGDQGRHRAALKKLLTDTANGTAYLPGELPHSVLPDAWQPQSVKPLLERYLGEDLPSIDREYQAFIRSIIAGVDPADEPQ
jgi:hypothetical protein